MSWTRNETAFLKDNYSKKPLDNLMSVLNRSKHSIFEKARQEGLLETKEGERILAVVPVSLSQSDMDLLSEVHTNVGEALKICLKSYLNPDFKIQYEIKQICNKFKIDFSILKLRRRTQRIIEQKKRIMAELRLRGYSYVSIAKEFNMSHATIMHHLKQDMASENAALNDD